MSWDALVGHRDPLDRLRKTWASGRRASTWLFVGPEGIGKRSFALQLARTLLCEKNRGDPFDSCDECPGCQMVGSGGHPDLLTVARPADRSFIPVEVLVGRPDHRRDEGLCRNIALKPVRGRGKVAIIDDADWLNQEGANALLKTLEEPPPETVIILIGTSVHRQLPTILSRCQVLRFSALHEDEVVRILQQDPSFQPHCPVEELARMSDGNVALARLLNDPDWLAFRKAWLERLSALDPAGDGSAALLLKFAEDGGKENAAKRARLGFAASVAMSFLSELLWSASGARPAHQPEPGGAARAAAATRTLDPNWIGRAIARTAQFQDDLSANLGFPAAIEVWLDDLSGLFRGRIPAPVVW